MPLDEAFTGFCPTCGQRWQGELKAEIEALKAEIAMLRRAPKRSDYTDRDPAKAMAVLRDGLGPVDQFGQPIQQKLSSDGAA
jgi:hypothetical protein